MPDPRLSAYRMGWLIGIAGIVMAGWMVHFWNAPLVLFYFVLGAGCWMLDAAQAPPDDGAQATADAEQQPQGTRFSRYAPRKRAPRTAASNPNNDGLGVRRSRPRTVYSRPRPE